MNVENKVCSKCGLLKPLSEYYYNKKQKYYPNACKVCLNAAGRLHRAKNKEKVAGAKKIYRNKNRERIAEWSRNYYASNKEYYSKYRQDNIRKRKSTRLIREYKITIEDYEKLLLEQGGVCAICKKSETIIEKSTNVIRPLAVDHDHKTGKIRGLLCGRCNQAIGLIHDCPVTAKAMSDYLIEHESIGIPWKVFFPEGVKL